MKVVAVCGMGIGTSVILKNNIEQALTEMGVGHVQVVAASIDSAQEASSSADLVVTSRDLAGQMGRSSAPVIVVDNLLDAEELRTKLEDHRK